MSLKEALKGKFYDENYPDLFDEYYKRMSSIQNIATFTSLSFSDMLYNRVNSNKRAVIEHEGAMLLCSCEGRNRNIQVLGLPLLKEEGHSEHINFAAQLIKEGVNVRYLSPHHSVPIEMYDDNASSAERLCAWPVFYFNKGELANLEGKDNKTRRKEIRKFIPDDKLDEARLTIKKQISLELEGGLWLRFYPELELSSEGLEAPVIKMLNLWEDWAKNRGGDRPQDLIMAKNVLLHMSKFKNNKYVNLLATTVESTAGELLAYSISEKHGDFYLSSVEAKCHKYSPRGVNQLTFWAEAVASELDTSGLVNLGLGNYVEANKTKIEEFAITDKRNVIYTDKLNESKRLFRPTETYISSCYNDSKKYKAKKKQRTLW